MSITRRVTVLRPLCRSFATTVQLRAKGDSSTIDFYKLPPSNYVPADAGPSIKIPILPDSYNLSSRQDTAANNSGPTAEFDEPLVSEVTETGKVSAMADADVLATTKAGGPSKEIPTEEHEDHAQEEPVKLEQLSENDKTTLWSIFGVITAWWLVGSFFDGKNKKEDKKTAAKH
ncbi:hypothetical protein DV453_004436 [Geotrichum candidum]|nr:hypothetical protein DV453_004436 [Geotrichum candidum]